MTTVDFVGRGWNFPLGVAPHGGIAMSSGVQKIEQAMRLVLTTYPGERPMRHEFGSRLRDFVFEGATSENVARIKHEVRTALDRWEPRAEVRDVAVHQDAATPSLLLIDIEYTVKATNDWRNLVFPFYTIPWNEED